MGLASDSRALFFAATPLRQCVRHLLSQVIETLVLIPLIEPATKSEISSTCNYVVVRIACSFCLSQLCWRRTEITCSLLL
jgi:hypothetical protein